ncbi:MAG: Holliday junction branch migration protein RuvA [Clostridiaceae bacterium]|nr:Holliday junction branch migration protein RuvA [Clostridiaceae bacterium]
MFAYLKGILIRKTVDSIIIDVNGVGYKVFTAGSALSTCSETGSEIKLHTHFYVREDTQALYGFLNEEELKMFEQLLTVSGVGPKAALSLVTYIPPSQFGLAVLTDDVESFTKAQGIGKKTAQRIILELKDKLKKLNDQLNDKKVETACVQPSDNKMKEAISALIMLGYSSQEASRTILTVYDEEKTIEQIIKDALKSTL